MSKQKPSAVHMTISVRQRSCRKVMFSVVSIRHSVHRGLPIWPFPWSNLTIQGSPPNSRICSNLFNLDLTVQAPTSVYSSYSWQAGGLRPSGMLSCWWISLPNTLVRSGGSKETNFGRSPLPAQFSSFIRLASPFVKFWISHWFDATDAEMFWWLCIVT